MPMYEIDTVVENDGVIHIPRQYLENIPSAVKVILFSNEEPLQNKTKSFSAMKLKTKGFAFNRELSLETAADRLYTDYRDDKELTVFTQLDCEEF
jgi:uncharacterized protein YpiB (UPF0302 family)